MIESSLTTAADAPVIIEIRMTNPAADIPEVLEGIQKLLVALVNLFNGLNVSTRQPAGNWQSIRKEQQRRHK